MSSLTIGWSVGIDGVGEARRHIWHSKGECILEIGSNRLTGPIVIEWIIGELIGPDTVRTVISFVVIDKELAATVRVQVNHRNIVC